MADGDGGQTLCRRLRETAENPTLTVKEAALISKIIQLSGISELFDCDTLVSSISLKNCLGLVVLAKHLNSDKLQQWCDEYITENLDIVSKTESSLSLPLSDLIEFLNFSNIPHSLKNKFIVERWKRFLNDEVDERLVSKLRIVAVIRILNEIKLLQSADDFFTKNLVSLLENSISVKNCLSIAILAEVLGNKGLKDCSEDFISKNMDDLISDEDFISLSPSDLADVLGICGISEKCKLHLGHALLKTFSPERMEFKINTGPDAVSIWDDVAQYNSILGIPGDLELSSDLKLAIHCLTVYKHQRDSVVENNGNAKEQDQNLELTGPGSRGRLGQKLLDNKNIEEQSHQVMMNMLLEQRKNKAFKKMTIGPKGGVLELYGCSVKFPSGALEKEKEITISVDNNPENYPKDGFVIAPILGIEPSLSFSKPVVVKMRTWFRGLDGEAKMATLFSRKEGSDWKKVGEVPLRSTNEIEFSVRHFSDNGVAVSKSNGSRGMHTLKNSVYIQRNTGMIQSNFYQSEKDEHDVNAVMRGRNCAVFTTQMMDVEGKLDDVLTVKVKLTSPEIKEVCGTAWRPTDRFTIERALRSDIFTIQAKTGRPSNNCCVEGDYEVFLGQEMKAYAFLAREWPVTLDPPAVQRSTINNTYHTAALNVSHGNGDITNTSYDNDLDLKANGQ